MWHNQPLQRTHELLVLVAPFWLFNSAQAVFMKRR